MTTEDQSAHVRPPADDAPENDPDQGPAAPDSHAPAVAGADVPGVLDGEDERAERAREARAQEDAPDTVFGEMMERPTFSEGCPVVGVTIEPDTCDVLAYDARGGAPIHMDASRDAVEFTSDEPMTPARLREFINHPEVWAALGALSLAD